MDRKLVMAEVKQNGQALAFLEEFQNDRSRHGGSTPRWKRFTICI